MKRGIGEVLVENGQITAQEFEGANKEAARTAEPVGRVLLRLGLVSEDNLKTILELHYGVNYVDLKKATQDPVIISLVPQALARQYEVIPVSREGNRLTLAMVNPTDSEGLENARQLLADWQVHVAVCSDDGFQDFVNRAYPLGESEREKGIQAGSQVRSGISAPVGKKATLLGAALEAGLQVNLEADLEAKTGQDKAVTFLGYHILSNAINRGCTNIHIEPAERQILIHYRKDGVLFSARKLPKAILSDLVKMFKAMAGHDNSEVVLPYDGFLNVRHDGQIFHFRLSIVPGTYGEHLVIWLE